MTPKNAWKKGQSGNPKGRYPLRDRIGDARKLARDAMPELVKRLLSVVRDEEMGAKPVLTSIDMLLKIAGGYAPVKSEVRASVEETDATRRLATNELVALALANAASSQVDDVQDAEFRELHRLGPAVDGDDDSRDDTRGS